MSSRARRAATSAVVIALVIAVPALSFGVLRRTPPNPHARSLYWGAWIGNQFTGGEAPWDWRAVRDFERRNARGKRLSVVQWSSPFSASWCGGSCQFDASTFEAVREHGVIPFFSWASSGIADRDIAAGKYDSYITSWAAAARAWGHPFFLRFDWEMNGSWFPWGIGNSAVGNTPAEYVAAWRHVHDLFRAHAATNATWVWCPNVDPSGNVAEFARLYPGARYVDWTCLDGYNGGDPWTSFRGLFATSYKIVTQIAPGKPMIIGEVASTDSGGNKARWVTDMFSALRAGFPAIRGVLWFDKNEPGLGGLGGHSDWPLERSKAASAAFAKAIDTSAFASSKFRFSTAAPIPPPPR